MTDNRTTELRDKLDALNIEHFDYDKGGRTQTQWEAPDGKRHFTYETSNNPAKTARLVIAWHPTPEQAIAATLGGGTCLNVHKEWEKSSFAGACTSFCCSECGAHYVDCECYYAGLADADEEQIRTNYCPNCGAKVVDTQEDNR